MKRYLADKSALARTANDSVRRVIEPMLRAGMLVTCAIVELEMLYSARSPDHYEREWELRGAVYHMLPIDQSVCERALEVQRALAARAEHRGASLPDLLIAACAEKHQVTVLHYDSDYDLIASVTGQPVQWIVPRGSVP